MVHMTPSPSVDAVLLAAAHMPGLACFDAGLQRTMVTWGDQDPCTELSAWREFVRSQCTLNADPSGFYGGGVIGWLGYEAGTTVERMPVSRTPRATHDLCLWRTEGGATLDHNTGQWIIRGSDSFRREANNIFQQANKPSAQPPERAAGRWVPQDYDTRSEQFQQGVKSILDAIHAGDVYQVNLAWEHANIPIDDGLQSWLNLRALNPARRGCYLKQGETEILSNSPELFLHIDGQTKTIRSTPIKGTAHTDGGETAKKALLVSPKEQAELTMIVDLVRNDIGRIASPGTVKAGTRVLRRCGDLWHAEQSISAQLAPNKDIVDVVAATFPPGSVTGAPKVRAMEVIHQLENQPRGVYTGALGWFADGGSAHFNVAIRTATVCDGFGRFHVGAGIVADSESESEWQETLAKARALANCLES